MKRLLTVVFCSMIFGVATRAQDIHFSQYTSAPMLLNPALTASWKDFELTLQQKMQWTSVKAYQTSGLSFEVKCSRFNWLKIDRMTDFYKKKLMKGLAVGLFAYADKAGDGALRTNMFEMSLAYHSRLDDYNALSAGFIGGIMQNSISADALRWNSQYNTNGQFDPNVPSGEIIDGSHVAADLGAGVLYTYGKQSRTITSNDETNFHAGISVMHINRPQMSFLGKDDRMHPRITFHASGTFELTNTNVALVPSLSYMRQGTQNELAVGMLMKFQMKEAARITGFIKSGDFLMGGYYRNKDAVAPYVGFEFAAYAIGISYDVNISGLKTVTNGNGGIEVMLRLQNPQAFLYQNKSKASID